MTDLHALIHRMADELDHYRQLLTDDRRELHPLATEARAVLAEADGPAVPDDREPASVDDSLALRVQRLEAMRETEKAALLDAFRQIDDLKHRVDFQYFKLCRLEDAIDARQP
jgi:hypothetical protein